MRTHILGLSLAVVMSCGIAAVLQPAVHAAGQRDRYERLRCESQSGRDEFCAAPIDGEVRVVRELGDTPCREGREWRWSRDGITVSRGCRAEFEYRVASRGSSSGYSRPGGSSGGYNMDHVTCQAEKNREQFCPSPIAGDVRVAKQLGDTQCVEGRNWSWSTDGIRVFGGCRAEFEYRRRSGGVNPNEVASRQRVTCQSMNGRESFCPAAIDSDVRVVRELGDVRCERGRNWNWTQDGVRVWDGCRADFDYRPK